MPRVRRAVRRAVLAALEPAIGALERRDRDVDLERLVASESARGPLGWSRRASLAATLPYDPLGSRGEGQIGDPIEVVIPCHEKDRATLALALAGLDRGVSNPVSRIRLIVPDAQVERFSREVDGTEVLGDAELLGEELLARLREHVPRQRYGWAVQQVGKLSAAMESSRPTLILDADTVLLRPRVWVDGARQVIAPSVEFVEEYERHAVRVWGGRRRPRVSFVTHHQLVQPDLLGEMFPRGRVDIVSWVAAADWSRLSPASEYHGYGAWLLGRHPSRAAAASWRNRAADRTVLSRLPREPAAAIDALRRRHPTAGSVSFHAYLD